MASPLDELVAEDRDLIVGLLSCIVDKGDSYQNRVIRITDTTGTRYFVAPRKDHSAQPESSLIHPTNVTPLLVAAGLAVEADPPSPRIDRKRNLVFPRQSQAFHFTALAINAYKSTFDLLPTEVQHRIGNTLLEHWHTYRGGRGVKPIDIPNVCKAIGVNQDQFFQNVYILKSLGYVHPGRYLEGKLENGYVFLTELKGLSWANAGSPPLGLDGTPVVNVTVNVTLQQVIREVESLRISDEDKERIELLFRRFQEETKKERPSYKPLQDLLDMATKVKELAPVLFKFGADHIDDIGRMTNNFPGL